MTTADDERVKRSADDVFPKEFKSWKEEPYTAIVVGSGCSVGLGVPALASFMDKVFDLGERCSSKQHETDKSKHEELAKHVNTIRDFVKRVKGSGSYLSTDLLNLEDLYGLADVIEDIYGGTGEGEAEAAFRRLIYEICHHAGEEFLAEQPHHGLPKETPQLEDILRESRTCTLSLGDRGSHFTTLVAYLMLASFKDEANRHPLFITFNWDLALDRALQYLQTIVSEDDSKKVQTGGGNDVLSPWMPVPDHGSAKEPFKETPLVAKPHGAIDWFDVQSITAGFSPLPVAEKGEAWTPTTACNSKPGQKITCQLTDKRGEKSREHTKDMKIVPPTWSKCSDSQAMLFQWKVILRALASVRQILFVGYSLPRTDLFFRHFLAYALARNDRLPRVYVWNPDVFDATHQTAISYRTLFAPLAREGRLYGIRGLFGDPANFDIQRAMRNAERLKPL